MVAVDPPLPRTLLGLAHETTRARTNNVRGNRGSAVRLRAVTDAEAEAVCAGNRPSTGPAWHPEYPLDEDIRACGGFADRSAAGEHRDPFGYYQVILVGPEGEQVVGGAGFHGPPILDTVEVGYSVVPDRRGLGIATAALERLLEIAGRTGVDLVIGSTGVANGHSRGVMSAAGMRPAGSDGRLCHFDWRPSSGAGAGPHPPSLGRPDGDRHTKTDHLSG